MSEDNPALIAIRRCFDATEKEYKDAVKERDTYRDLCDELKNKLIASRFMFEAYGINLQKLGDEINESITKAEAILGDKNGNAN